MKNKEQKLSADIVKKVYGNDIDSLKQNVDKYNINSIDKDGRTLLIHFVIAKNFVCLTWLVEIGAGMNVKDKLGWTALHYAAQNYLMEIVSVLMSAGADVNAQDEHGNSILWRAVFASQGRGEIIKTLLANGANPNLKNLHNVSPIELANTIANYNVKQFFQ